MSAEAVKRREASSRITKLLGLAKRSAGESEENLNSALDQLEETYKEYCAAQDEVLGYTGEFAFSF